MIDMLYLEGSDGVTYTVPIGEVDGEKVYILPEHWPEHKKEAFFDYMYPNGYMTIQDNSITRSKRQFSAY